jgi:hypothetical protein
MTPPLHENPEQDLDAASMADLTALADGSLGPARKQEVLDRAEGSPELGATLDEQRRAIGLLAQAADVRAPEELRARIEELVDRRSRRRSLARPRGVASSPHASRGRRRLAGASVAALAVAAALAIGLVAGGSAGPTLGEYVALGSKPAIGGPPQKARGGASQLAVRVDGVPFPYLEDRFGWSASGVRSDTIAGHAVTTVFYGDHGSHVSYSIVAGTPPSLSGLASGARGGRAVWRGGVRYWVQRVGDTTTVVWTRNGHRCIVSAHGLSSSQLLMLASWTGARHLA